MNKGIVMQLDSKYMIVMMADGQFCKVKKGSSNRQIGEEVNIPNTVTFLKRKSVQALLATSAAAVLVFVIFSSSLGGFGGVRDNQVAAYVTMDINPSIELGINDKEIVIEARGINEDGLKLLSGMDVEGVSLDEATDVIMNEVDEQGYLSKEDGDIVISSTLIHENETLEKKEIAEKVRRQVRAAILVKHPDKQEAYPVTALEAPKELRKAALSKGISTSKMALYLQAKSEGEEIPLEELQHKSIHAIVKSHTKLEKIVKKNIATKKELIKLLDDEKQGKLNQGEHEQDEDGEITVPAVTPVDPVKSNLLDKADSIKKSDTHGKSKWDKDREQDDQNEKSNKDRDKKHDKDRNRNNNDDKDSDDNNNDDKDSDDEKLSSQKNSVDTELVFDKKLRENERLKQIVKEKAIKLQKEQEKEKEQENHRKEKAIKEALEKAKEAAIRKKQEERNKQDE